jgi:hypothetical protein
MELMLLIIVLAMAAMLLTHILSHGDEVRTVVADEIDMHAHWERKLAVSPIDKSAMRNFKSITRVNQTTGEIEFVEYVPAIRQTTGE